MIGELLDLMRPPPGLGIDFARPIGEPALVASDSVSWRVFANPVALFVGGVAAVLLELAEPSVRAGVWERSSFRSDPVTRLWRTGYAAMVTVYGPRSVAEAMIARVGRLHAQVAGATYRADDPRLLSWVQATATFGFSEAYSRYVAPLSPVDRDAVFREGLAAANLYGATGAPTSRSEWAALLAPTHLEGSAVLTEFLVIMDGAPILPPSLCALQRLLVRAAVELVPEPVRSLPQLRDRGMRAGEARLVRLLGRAAGRLPLGHLPPEQARRRMR